RCRRRESHSSIPAQLAATEWRDKSDSFSFLNFMIDTQCRLLYFLRGDKFKNAFDSLKYRGCAGGIQGGIFSGEGLRAKGMAHGGR
ncbi:MAG: hypothetical protein KDH97_22365, partial [Calditrichaeota bacterium]|nr:hypothetical protein [Calditrichota bacterium]